MTRWSVLWLIGAALALPASGQNLLTNPTFTSGIEGWSTANTSWVSSDGNPTGSGPGAVEVVAPLINGGGYFTYQVVAVTPGTEYTISGWSFVADSADNPAAGAEPSIVWLKDQTVLSQSFFSPIQTRGQWVSSTQKATAPSGANQAKASFGVRGPVSGAGTPRARWDDVYFGTGQPATTSVDYFIPAAAYSPGQLGTFWTTDVSIYNPLAVPLKASATFFKGTGDNSSASPVALTDIAPGATLAVTNIVQMAGGSGTGAVRIRVTPGSPSERVLAVMNARTWTSGSGGTYGQGTVASRVSSATTRAASGIVQDADFRTNIGVFNPTSAAVQARVRVFDASGVVVYDQTWSLGAFGHRQESLSKLGINDLSGGTLVIDGPGVIGYVTPVDNTSGDAAYFEAQPLG
jgi:hypothetical protein